MRKVKWIFLCLTCWTTTLSAQDRLLEVMKDELGKQMRQLQGTEFPPYYMNYRAVDEQRVSIVTSFGALMSDNDNHVCLFVPQVRLGSPVDDNFKNLDRGCAYSMNRGPSVGYLPVDDRFSEEAIRDGIWKETAERYKFAVNTLQQMKGVDQISVESEDKSPSFSKSPVEHYYEAPLTPEQMKIDKEGWVKKLKQISAVFRKYPEILKGDASLVFKVVRTYFVSSEGTEVVHNLTYTNLIVSGETRAEDGMNLPLHLSYFAYQPDGLPGVDLVLEETEKLVEKLMALREAPVMSPYDGPAMLSGAAAGVFFHEIFGHRVEGQRMRNDMDGQTFKKMIGKEVLPASMQVYDDPTLREFGRQDLNGFYKYDEQGVKAERVDVVVDGKMNDFLMTRKPLEGHARSNGHARAMGGFDPASRQSNLMIETKDHKTEDELKQLFLEEIKAQGKEFGYFFKQVSGGFTLTSVKSINSFTVQPLEVYKVFTDGSPDQLVRGVSLIGTPLAMFSNIIYAGGESEVFTGMCGAESGSIPVTAVSPALLVKKVEIQRVPKSSVEHPILKRP